MLNLMVMCDTVNSKLGYDQRGCGKHFFPDTINFDTWRKKKGYVGKDPDGKSWNSSQIWYAEWVLELSEGLYNETPYLDFWHWQIGNCIVDRENFRNDSIQTIYVGMDLVFTEEWQRVIQQVWCNLYYELSDNGYLEVEVSW